MRTEEIMAKLQAKYPTEKEYLQAVREVLECIEDVYNKHPEFENARIIERLVEPDRMFTFRVTWVDDKGEVQTNTGYRVQFNNAIGFLEGMYKKLTREHNGVLTGKGLSFGGSLIRPEATGFGAVYFLQHMLHNHKADLDIKGKTVAVSGFGNVSWGACVKATELGAKVVAISGPDGVIYNPNGMTKEKLDYMLELRASCNDVVAPFAEKFPDATFTPGKKAWSVKCDIAMTCAFQNEMSKEDAEELIANGTWCCVEVSNMGCQPGAIEAFQKARILFAPGKAVNAGGVATSGLEMTQNAMHLSWTAKEVDEKLHGIMDAIHASCVKYGTQEDGYINYVKGANIAGFMKVAEAMLAQGIF